MSQRQYSPLDHLFINLDQALRTVVGRPQGTGRLDPADTRDELELSEDERDLSARLMRINHAGEVSAQALYQGQALTAKLPAVRTRMERAAEEENDHLLWCEKRTRELGGHVSYLSPLWYAGSFAIGAAAGLAGDKWSLGFVAETEHQVVRHLDEHLGRMASQDAKSRAILEQMKDDEAHHASVAIESGAAPLPGPVKGLMGLVSKLMTKTAYWV